MLIDVHCHLDDKQFNDLDKVILDSKKNNVKKIITNGLNHESNVKCLKISEKYDIVDCAMGLYPIDALELSDDEINEEILFIKKNKKDIVAIGEVGLDYYWIKDKKNKDELKVKQKNIFKKFIELSEEIKKPLIVHSRNAEEDIISILESSKNKKIILHCFSGNKKLIKKAEDLGFYFSVPTNIIYSRHFQELVKEVNLSRLLTETDAPYLGPVKGERNVPKNVAFSVKKIALLKGMDEEEVKNNIFMNYERVF